MKQNPGRFWCVQVQAQQNRFVLPMARVVCREPKLLTVTTTAVGLLDRHGSVRQEPEQIPAREVTATMFLYGGFGALPTFLAWISSIRPG